MIEMERTNYAQAIENCQKFLDLWNDADPGITAVEDTRERISRLKGTQD
jgi:hypothetical protein